MLLVDLRMLCHVIELHHFFLDLLHTIILCPEAEKLKLFVISNLATWHQC